MKNFKTLREGKAPVTEMHCKDCGCERGNINPDCDCPNDGSAPITASHWKEQANESINKMRLINIMKKASPAAKKALEAPSRVDNKDDKKVNELTIADVNKATEKAKKRQAKERETTGKSSVSSTDLAARMPRKENVRSADKKAETYRKPDGKMGTRMVPMDKTVMTSELNKSTMGSYVKKATDQLEKGKVKNVNKIGNRAVGIDTATDKMRKRKQLPKNTNTIKAGKDQEVETQTQESNLNELSPKTMGRYVGAASTSLKTAAQKSGSGSYATQAARRNRYKDLKTATKRKQGIDMAAKKLSKESVEEGAMKRMASGDGMDTFKKKPPEKKEAFSSRAIVKKPRAGDGKPMSNKPIIKMRDVSVQGVARDAEKYANKDKKATEEFDARAIMKKAKAQGARPDQTNKILKRNSPAHKAAVKRHIATMKSNRPASRPTTEDLDEVAMGRVKKKPLAPIPALKKANIKHTHNQSSFKKNKTMVGVSDKDYNKAKKIVGNMPNVMLHTEMSDMEKTRQMATSAGLKTKTADQKKKERDQQNKNAANRPNPEMLGAGKTFDAIRNTAKKVGKKAVVGAVVGAAASKVAGF
tara:strand:- start:11719 stop:13476 length:1758 start_codon:yes stop_codon:yes gene_type:complete